MFFCELRPELCLHSLPEGAVANQVGRGSCQHLGGQQDGAMHFRTFACRKKAVGMAGRPLRNKGHPDTGAGDLVEQIAEVGGAGLFPEGNLLRRMECRGRIRR